MTPEIPGFSEDDTSLALCFRALESVLREDPALQRVVKGWSTLRGEPYELDPPQETQMPYVRLTVDPSSLLNTWLTLDRINLVVLAEVAVAGTNVTNLLNLWQAVHNACRRDKPHRGTTVWQFLRNPLGLETPRFKSVLHLKVERPNLQANRIARVDPKAPPGPIYLSASCHLDMLMFLPTSNQ